MRILFIAILALHGVVHTIGFLRAFGLMEGKNYSMPVSKTMGLLWLLTAILFEVVAIMVFNHNKQWWILGSIAVILSQFLIIWHWHDTKFGTIINIIVLAAIIVHFGSWHFARSFTNESEVIMEREFAGYYTSGACTYGTFNLKDTEYNRKTS